MRRLVRKAKQWATLTLSIQAFEPCFVAPNRTVGRDPAKVKSLYDSASVDPETNPRLAQVLGTLAVEMQAQTDTAATLSTIVHAALRTELAFWYAGPGRGTVTVGVGGLRGSRGVGCSSHAWRKTSALNPEALQYRAQRQPAVSPKIDKSVQLGDVNAAGAGKAESVEEFHRGAPLRRLAADIVGGQELQRVALSASPSSRVNRMGNLNTLVYCPSRSSGSGDGKAWKALRRSNR